jgi:hypothetical protein
LHIARPSKLAGLSSAVNRPGNITVPYPTGGKTKGISDHFFWPQLAHSAPILSHLKPSPSLVGEWIDFDTASLPDEISQVMNRL